MSSSDEPPRGASKEAKRIPLPKPGSYSASFSRVGTSLNDEDFVEENGRLVMRASPDGPEQGAGGRGGGAAVPKGFSRLSTSAPVSSTGSGSYGKISSDQRTWMPSSHDAREIPMDGEEGAAGLTPMQRIAAMRPETERFLQLPLDREAGPEGSKPGVRFAGPPAAGAANMTASSRGLPPMTAASAASAAGGAGSTGPFKQRAAPIVKDVVVERGSGDRAPMGMRVGAVIERPLQAPSLLQGMVGQGLAFPAPFHRSMGPSAALNDSGSANTSSSAAAGAKVSRFKQMQQQQQASGAHPQAAVSSSASSSPSSAAVMIPLPSFSSLVSAGNTSAATAALSKPAQSPAVTDESGDAQEEEPLDALLSEVSQRNEALLASMSAGELREAAQEAASFLSPEVLRALMARRGGGNAGGVVTSEAEPAVAAAPMKKAQKPLEPVDLSTITTEEQLWATASSSLPKEERRKLKWTGGLEDRSNGADKDDNEDEEEEDAPLVRDAFDVGTAQVHDLFSAAFARLKEQEAANGSGSGGSGASGDGDDDEAEGAMGNGGSISSAVSSTLSTLGFDVPSLLAAQSQVYNTSASAGAVFSSPASQAVVSEQLQALRDNPETAQAADTLSSVLAALTGLHGPSAEDEDAGDEKEAGAIKKTKKSKAAKKQAPSSIAELAYASVRRYRFDLQGRLVCLSVGVPLTTSASDAQSSPSAAPGCGCDGAAHDHSDSDQSLNVLAALGLLNHGDDPEAPGYTLFELCGMCRSRVHSQRSLAYRSLAGMLLRRRAAFIASPVPPPDFFSQATEASDSAGTADAPFSLSNPPWLLPWPLEAAVLRHVALPPVLPVLLRLAVDDSKNLGTLIFGMQALRAFLCPVTPLPSLNAAPASSSASPYCDVEDEHDRALAQLSSSSDSGMAEAEDAVAGELLVASVSLSSVLPSAVVQAPPLLLAQPPAVFQMTSTSYLKEGGSDFARLQGGDDESSAYSDNSPSAAGARSAADVARDGRDCLRDPFAVIASPRRMAIIPRLATVIEETIEPLLSQWLSALSKHDKAGAQDGATMTIAQQAQQYGTPALTLLVALLDILLPIASRSLSAADDIARGKHTVAVSIYSSSIPEAGAATATNASAVVVKTRVPLLLWLCDWVLQTSPLHDLTAKAASLVAPASSASSAALKRLALTSSSSSSSAAIKSSQVAAVQALHLQAALKVLKLVGIIAGHGRGLCRDLCESDGGLSGVRLDSLLHFLPLSASLRELLAGPAQISSTESPFPRFYTRLLEQATLVRAQMALKATSLLRMCLCYGFASDRLTLLWPRLKEQLTSCHASHPATRVARRYSPALASSLVALFASGLLLAITEVGGGNGVAFRSLALGLKTGNARAAAVKDAPSGAAGTAGAKVEKQVDEASALAKAEEDFESLLASTSAAGNHTADGGFGSLERYLRAHLSTENRLRAAAAVNASKRKGNRALTHQGEDDGDADEDAMERQIMRAAGEKEREQRKEDRENATVEALSEGGAGDTASSCIQLAGFLRDILVESLQCSLPHSSAEDGPSVFEQLAMAVSAGSSSAALQTLTHGLQLLTAFCTPPPTITYRGSSNSNAVSTWRFPWNGPSSGSVLRPASIGDVDPARPLAVFAEDTDATAALADGEPLSAGSNGLLVPPHAFNGDAVAQASLVEAICHALLVPLAKSSLLGAVASSLKSANRSSSDGVRFASAVSCLLTTLVSRWPSLVASSLDALVIVPVKNGDNDEEAVPALVALRSQLATLLDAVATQAASSLPSAGNANSGSAAIVATTVGTQSALDTLIHEATPKSKAAVASSVEAAKQLLDRGVSLGWSCEALPELCAPLAWRNTAALSVSRQAALSFLVAGASCVEALSALRRSSAPASAEGVAFDAEAESAITSASVATISAALPGEEGPAAVALLRWLDSVPSLPAGSRDGMALLLLSSFEGFLPNTKRAGDSRAHWLIPRETSGANTEDDDCRSSFSALLPLTSRSLRRAAALAPGSLFFRSNSAAGKLFGAAFIHASPCSSSAEGTEGSSITATTCLAGFGGTLGVCPTAVDAGTFTPALSLCYGGGFASSGRALSVPRPDSWLSHSKRSRKDLAVSGALASIMERERSQAAIAAEAAVSGDDDGEEEAVDGSAAPSDVPDERFHPTHDILAAWSTSLIKLSPHPLRYAGNGGSGGGCSGALPTNPFSVLVSLPLQLGLVLDGSFGGSRSGLDPSAALVPPIIEDALYLSSSSSSPSSSSFAGDGVGGDHEASPTEVLAKLGGELLSFAVAAAGSPSLSPVLTSSAAPDSTTQKWLRLYNSGSQLFSLMHLGLSNSLSAGSDGATVAAFEAAVQRLVDSEAALRTDEASAPTPLALLLTHPGIGLGVLRTLAGGLIEVLKTGEEPSVQTALALGVLLQGHSRGSSSSTRARLLGQGVRELNGAVMSGVGGGGGTGLASDMTLPSCLTMGLAAPVTKDVLRLTVSHSLASPTTPPALYLSSILGVATTLSGGASDANSKGQDDDDNESAFEPLRSFVTSMREPPKTHLGDHSSDDDASALLLSLTDVATVLADASSSSGVPSGMSASRHVRLQVSFADVAMLRLASLLYHGTSTGAVELRGFSARERLRAVTEGLQPSLRGSGFNLENTLQAFASSGLASLSSAHRLW